MRARSGLALALALSAPVRAEEPLTRIEAALVAVDAGVTDENPVLILGGLKALSLLGVADAAGVDPGFLEQAALSAMLWARGDRDLATRLAAALSARSDDPRYLLRALDDASACQAVSPPALLCVARSVSATSAAGAVLAIHEVER